MLETATQQEKNSRKNKAFPFSTTVSAAGYIVRTRLEGAGREEEADVAPSQFYGHDMFLFLFRQNKVAHCWPRERLLPPRGGLLEDIIWGIKIIMNEASKRTR